mmetsp:Transcript_7072/g.21557  ORF Transcript_7072/g.21557 Transcript_7072/m.21557 type:complete len:1945 (+) Transcript_7072:1330-7164(+)
MGAHRPHAWSELQPSSSPKGSFDVQSSQSQKHNSDGQLRTTQSFDDVAHRSSSPAENHQPRKRRASLPSAAALASQLSSVGFMSEVPPALTEIPRSDLTLEQWLGGESIHVTILGASDCFSHTFLANVLLRATWEHSPPERTPRQNFGPQFDAIYRPDAAFLQRVPEMLQREQMAQKQHIIDAMRGSGSSSGGTGSPSSAATTTPNCSSAAELLGPSNAFLLPERAPFQRSIFVVNYSAVPQLVVTFPSERQVRLTLWQLHQVADGALQLEQELLLRLRRQYAALLNLTVEQGLVAGCTSEQQLPLASDLLSVLGRTLCYRGLGADLCADRLYLREQMLLLGRRFGGMISEYVISVPSSLVARHLELTVTAPTSRRVLFRQVRKSSLLAVAVDARGITPSMAQLLESSRYWPEFFRQRSADKRRIVFVQIPGDQLPAQLLSEAAQVAERSRHAASVVSSSAATAASSSSSAGAGTGAQAEHRALLRSQVASVLQRQANLNHVPFDESTRRAISSLVSVLVAKPLRFCSLPDSGTSSQMSPLAGGRGSLSKLRSSTNIPALVGSIQNLALRKCAVPLRDQHRERLLTRSNPSSRMLLPRQHAAQLVRYNTSGVDRMRVVARETIESWKKELQRSAELMDQRLLRKATQCVHQANDQLAGFTQKFMTTTADCEQVLDPSRQQSGEKGANVSELACGALLQRAPQYWKEGVLNRAPQHLHQVMQMSSLLLNEAQELIRRQVPETTSVEERARIEEQLGSSKDELVQYIRQRVLTLRNEINQDAGQIVRAACEDAVREDILIRARTLSQTRDGKLSPTSPKHYQQLVLDSLPQVSGRAARNISHQFEQLLKRAIAQLEKLEQDLGEAVNNLYKVRSTFLIPEPLGDVINSDEEQKFGRAGSRARTRNIGIERRDPTLRGSGRMTVLAPPAAPQVFGARVWQMSDGARLQQFARYQQSLKDAGLAVLQVRVDPSCQFRAMAQQVYGTENAHHVVRYMTLNQMLTESHRYEDAVAEQGIDLQEYVAQMSGDDKLGDHLTLRAMADLYSTNILVYSPVFPQPVLVPASSSITDRVYCLAYTGHNTFHSLVLEEDLEAHMHEPISTSDSGGDESEGAMDWSSESSDSSSGTDLRMSRAQLHTGELPSSTSAGRNSTFGYGVEPRTRFAAVTSAASVGIVGESSGSRTTNPFSAYHPTAPTGSGSSNTEQSPFTANVSAEQGSSAMSSSEDTDAEEDVDVDEEESVSERSDRDQRREEPVMSVVDEEEVADDDALEMDVSGSDVVPACSGSSSVATTSSSLATASASASAAAAAAASASSTSSSTLGSSAKLAQAARRALAAQTQRANDAALTCPTRLTDLCVRAVAHQLPSYREPLSAYLAPSMVQRLLACLVAEDRLDVSAIWSLLTEETRSLELTGWRLCNPEALAALCKQCPHLQRVSLRDCAHLESAALAVLLRGCTQLEVLDVSGCSHLGDQAFTSLGPGSLPVLSRLRLDGLAALSDAGIARLLSAAPALQALSMQRCAALTDTGLSALRAPLRSVDLSQCTQLSDDTVRQLAVVSGRQLHMAALSGLQLGDAALATLAQHCSALTSVSVAGCQRITDHGLLQLMRSCGALGELNVADCRGLTGEAFSRLEVALPALQRLNLARCFHLEPQHTRRLAERCPSLIDLDLQSCEALTDECIAALSHCCRHLEALRLANCMRLTDQAVLAIAQHSGPSLHELSLHNCGALTDGAVEQLARSCRSLQVLDLSWCEELTDRSLVAIAANLPALRTLRLEQVSRPSSPGYAALAEHCQQLRVLSLGYTAVDDHQLIALARGASLLEELDLSACQQLSAAAIRQAVAVLPSLRVLSLRRYERLDALTVAHPGLRALRLSFCAHLTDDCLLKLAVACPSLRELDVAWCTRLGSASIHQLPMHCPHLSTLSIRGCRGVAMLTVNALTARGVLVRR